MKILNLEGKLELKNEGFLEIIFLGTGTSFTQKLFNNNMIIIKGDTHLLVDFGFNGPYSLEKNLGLAPTDIENLLITHSHADHIGGVEYLALLNRYVGRPLHNKKRLNLITTDEYSKVLWNSSLKGGLEWNEASENRKMEIADYFKLIYAEPFRNHFRNKYKIKFGEIELELFDTNHIPDSAKTPKQAFITYGLFIDNKIFYSGDTKFDQSLIDMYADRSEVMFHDCSFEENPVHTSISQLRQLPPEIRKKMYLMHYSDNYENYDVSDFAGLAREGTRYILE